MPALRSRSVRNFNVEEKSSLILRRHLESVPVKFVAVAGAKLLRYVDAFAREMGA